MVGVTTKVPPLMLYEAPVPAPVGLMVNEVLAEHTEPLFTVMIGQELTLTC